MADTITLRAYLDDLNALLRDESFNEVISHCRYILQHYPQNVHAYRLLGQALLQRANYEGLPEHYSEAAEVLQRVLSVAPSDHVAHLGLSEIRQQQGQLDQAIRHLERTYEQMPGNIALQDALKELSAQRSGDTGEPPGIQLTRGALARQYASGQLYDQALTELRSALEENVDRVDLEELLVEILWESHHPVEAAEVALSLLKKLPNCLSANRILARMWLSHGRPTEAEVFLEHIEAVDPYAVMELLRPGEQVPDANRLSRLDYSTHAVATLSSETPDWVHELSGLGEDFGLGEIPSPAPMSTALPGEDAGPGVGAVDTSAISGGGQSDLGSADWLDGVAAGDLDQGLPDWSGGALFDSEAAATDGLPSTDPFAVDWTTSPSPSTDVQLPEDAAESALPDWFSDAGNEGDVGTMPAFEQPAAGAEEQPLVPDWLPTTGEPADDFDLWRDAADQGSAEPDWLPQSGEEGLGAESGAPVEPDVLTTAPEGLSPDWPAATGDGLGAVDDMFLEDSSRAVAEDADWPSAVTEMGPDTEWLAGPDDLGRPDGGAVSDSFMATLDQPLPELAAAQPEGERVADDSEWLFSSDETSLGDAGAEVAWLAQEDLDGGEPDVTPDTAVAPEMKAAFEDLDWFSEDDDTATESQFEDVEWLSPDAVQPQDATAEDVMDRHEAEPDASESQVDETGVGFEVAAEEAVPELESIADDSVPTSGFTDLLEGIEAARAAAVSTPEVVQAEPTPPEWLATYGEEDDETVTAPEVVPSFDAAVLEGESDLWFQDFDDDTAGETRQPELEKRGDAPETAAGPAGFAALDGASLDYDDEKDFLAAFDEMPGQFADAAGFDAAFDDLEGDDHPSALPVSEPLLTDQEELGVPRVRQDHSQDSLPDWGDSEDQGEMPVSEEDHEAFGVTEAQLDELRRASMPPADLEMDEFFGDMQDDSAESPLFGETEGAEVVEETSFDSAVADEASDWFESLEEVDDAVSLDTLMAGPEDDATELRSTDDMGEAAEDRLLKSMVEDDSSFAWDRSDDDTDDWLDSFAKPADSDKTAREDEGIHLVSEDMAAAPSLAAESDMDDWLDDVSDFDIQSVTAPPAPEDIREFERDEGMPVVDVLADSLAEDQQESQAWDIDVSDEIDMAVAESEQPEGLVEDEAEPAESGPGRLLNIARQTGALDDDRPAWMADMDSVDALESVESDVDGALDEEPYDPFEGGSPGQVPEYRSAKDTGILQPDEQPEWLKAFTGELIAPEEILDDDFARQEVPYGSPGEEGLTADDEVDEEPGYIDEGYVTDSLSDLAFDDVESEYVKEDDYEPVDDQDELADEDESDMPDWLLAITESEADKLDDLLPDEAGSYSATDDTGVLQPSSQPDWLLEVSEHQAEMESHGAAEEEIETIASLALESEMADTIEFDEGLTESDEQALDFLEPAEFIESDLMFEADAAVEDAVEEVSAEAFGGVAQPVDLTHTREIESEDDDWFDDELDDEPVPDDFSFGERPPMWLREPKESDLATRSPAEHEEKTPEPPEWLRDVFEPDDESDADSGE